MKKYSPLSRVFSLLLILTLSFGLASPAAAAPAEEEKPQITWKQVDNGSAPELETAHEAAEPVEETPLYADTDTVRVSIVLENASTLDVGYSTQSIAENPSAMRYRSSLKAQQAKMEKNISARALSGEKLDVVWNLTLAANIISANVEFGQIDAIKAVKGVRDVVIERLYSPCVTSIGGEDPMMATSSAMIGSAPAWADGYTGAGSRIAIVDTGLDTDHQSFDDAGYTYSLQKNAERLGMSYEDYAAGLDLLTKEEVAAKWSDLNFSTRYGAASDTFFTDKVPFGANYVDSSAEITHDGDTQGEHGSHVAGIAAANSYIAAGDGFAPALEAVYTQGVAPDAQLLIMKVFGTNGGAYDSDYMAAIEDAIVLGADVVNLSLGSANAGPSVDPTYQYIFDSLTASDTVVSISAGNNASWADHTMRGYLYSDGVNLDTVGHPGSLTNALTVAAADNDGVTGSYFLIGGEQIFYNDPINGGAPMTTLSGEQSFIYFDNTGVDAAGNSLFTEAVRGKIVACNRGISPFTQKLDAAAAAGAIGLIVVNNAPGVIKMTLEGASSDLPCVSVLQSVGALLKSVGALRGEAYEGTLTVSDGVETVFYGSDSYTMSASSAFGVPGSLELKPEITAPGGNIYSVNGAIPGGKAYELMSGTSMAAPQIAGMAALVAQYVRKTGLAEKTGLSTRQLAQSLLMSTAVPQLEAGSGSYYSVLKQGAGLANVSDAIHAGSYLVMPEGSNAGAADGKIKVELGDDPDRTGTYSFGFELHNLEEEDKRFDLSAAFFTQDLFRLTEGGERYLDTQTAPLDFSVSWTADGQTVVPEGMDAVADCDFNGDGSVGYDDGVVILDSLVGNAELGAKKDAADLDGNGTVNSYDALLFFKILNSSVVTVPGGGSVTVGVTVTLHEMEKWDDCGAYVEGFVFAEEHGTPEGAVGDSHSIPVLGYYGGWDESSMFDVGSYLEYAYGTEQRPPYLFAAAGTDALNFNAYQIVHADDGKPYYFGGNPFGLDESYLPERNAFNSACGDVISQVSFAAVRNAADSRFTIVDSEGKILREDINGGLDCAFYYDKPSQWVNLYFTMNIGFTGKGIPEGTRLTMALTFAPEYYVRKDGTVDWASLNEACSLSIPFVIDNTAPVLENVEPGEGELTLTVSDNQYVAAVVLYDDAGNLLGVYGSDAEAEAGGASSYLFRTAEGVDRYLVEVYDFARNLSTYKLDFGAAKSENTVPAETRREETVRAAVSADSLPAEAPVAVSGSLNSVAVSHDAKRARPAESVSSVSGSFALGGDSFLVLDVTARSGEGSEVYTESGIVRVEYDAEGLELVNAGVFADFYSIRGARFAYADPDGIAAGEPLASFTFRVLDGSKTGLTVVTEETGTANVGFEAPGYEEKVGAAENHAELEARGRVDATCTEDGMTGDIYCLDCGRLLMKSRVVPKLGHDYGEWYETKAATCSEPGAERHDCSRCTSYETRELAKTPHSFSEVWSSDAAEHWHAATCGHDLRQDAGSHTDAAVKDHKCDVCGFVMSRCADTNRDGVCEYCGAAVYGVYLNVRGKQNKTLLLKLNLTNTYTFEPTVFGASVKKVQYSIDGGLIWFTGSSVTLLSIDRTFHVRVTDSTGAKTVFTVRDGVPTLR